MKNNTCNPKINTTSFSCYTLEQLKNIAKTLNKRGKNIKIVNNKRILWNNINDIMKNECSKEWCWANSSYLSNTNNDLNEMFRPIHPDDWLENNLTWLSNFDIDNVLEQYEKVDNDFIFLGPVPIDFEDIYTELTKKNLNDLYNKGKKKIGIVFNLDPHYMGGSHWVAMFINIVNKKKGIIAYYDSYGIEPNKRIQDLMSKFIAQGLVSNNKENLILLEPLYNPIRHQHKNSECGMYSINFIISMLKSTGTRNDFFKICKNIISDDNMNKLRQFYFLNNGKKNNRLK